MVPGRLVSLRMEVHQLLCKVLQIMPETKDSEQPDLGEDVPTHGKGLD